MTSRLLETIKEEDPRFSFEDDDRILSGNAAVKVKSKQTEFRNCVCRRTGRFG